MGESNKKMHSHLMPSKFDTLNFSHPYIIWETSSESVCIIIECFCILLQMLGYTWCIGPPSTSGLDGTGGRRQRAGQVRAHPSWYSSSTSQTTALQDALVQHQSPGRRQRPMPLVQPVYSFQVTEDTEPGHCLLKAQKIAIILWWWWNEKALIQVSRLKQNHWTSI